MHRRAVHAGVNGSFNHLGLSTDYPSRGERGERDLEAIPDAVVGGGRGEEEDEERERTDFNRSHRSRFYAMELVRLAKPRFYRREPGYSSPSGLVSLTKRSDAHGRS